MLTVEGAHSLPRILHAHGDATGAEIGRSLLAKARFIPNIDLRPWVTCDDLLIDEKSPGRLLGLTALDHEGGIAEIDARAVLLASGGAGQVYSDTTNPTVATGDGIAMAYRGGAEIADMEFYQFHPTALSLPGVPVSSPRLCGVRALISATTGMSALWGGIIRCSSWRRAT